MTCIIHRRIDCLVFSPIHPIHPFRHCRRFPFFISSSSSISFFSSNFLLNVRFVLFWCSLAKQRKMFFVESHPPRGFELRLIPRKNSVSNQLSFQNKKHGKKTRYELGKGPAKLGKTQLCAIKLGKTR